MAKTGERKSQILQTLAAMLENPKGERITTALLAARLDVSEAALYRHFASKAQMFEGLIEFVEQTVFTLVNKIQAEETDPMKQVEATVATLLGFAQKNPGMTRVLIGDALVNEDERLQTLAAMLEDPKGERITTALLAARLDVSEAALYRHFASKAQMFEGLIEFIEQTVFTLVNKIQTDETDAMKQIESTITTLLAFAQKNPGMTRVLTGDALVNEDERLQARVNQLLDRLEAML
ncbi:MAG TPA: nucleoid occlusion factor SlmA, partial [Usitatibacter sp.]|nr:nucleoid occlusion factor SlmA [Usitatibacter sp.]